MSKTLPVSVRLAPELNKQVTDIAHALDRPKSWVIEQAIKGTRGGSGVASRGH